MKPKLKYIGLSLLVGTAALVCAVSPAQAADKKPNILVIWGDDIGIHNISAYNLGIMGYHTPNIDRIAKEGALSPMPTPSKAARRAAPPSSWGSIHSVPAC
jgi:hypothetical protein